MRVSPLLAVLCAVLPVSAQQSTPPSQLNTTQTVVVTAASDPSTLAGSDRTVIVLDPHAQPHAFEALPDVLRLDTSLNLQERGPDGVQADLSIRGATFEESLILLNGMRVDDPQTGHFNLDIPVPLDAIRRVEVLHGAGSAFYGSDAIAGAADLISEEPERPADSRGSRLSLRARAGYSSFQSTEQHIIVDYATHRFSEELAGSRDTSSGFIADRNYRSEAVSSESWLHTRLGATDVLLAGSDRPFGANQFYGPYESFEHTKGWLAMLEQQLGQHMQAGLSYRRHSDVFILEANDPSFYENNHVDEAWQGVVRRTDLLGRGIQISTGLDGSADTINSSSLGRHGRNQGAGYASLDLGRWKRMTLSLAGREEVFSGGANDFSPTFAAGYRSRDDLRLRASAGHAFRLPTYTDLYYSDPTSVGNPDLKPETSWSYEAGVVWTPGRASLELTGFQNRIGNSIDYVKTSPDARYQATNTGAVAFTGAETALHLRLGNAQQIELGYTGVHASHSLPSGYISAYVFNYAAQSGLFSWSAVVRHQIVARTQVAIVQRAGRTAYPVWDTAIARNAGHLQPYLRFDNLSNTGYEEIPGVLMAGRSITGGIAFTWAYGR
jgi:outer membrane cobalamin receptor